MSGVFRDGAMLQSVIVGLTNLTFTMLGMVLIDKLGRRTLIAIGVAGIAVNHYKEAQEAEELLGAGAVHSVL